jgi:3-hydroxyacyl-CoA dehydrogenase/enoyl-CoA hydratase/3-hydroxybutyryl-CoA epimerase
MSDEHVWTLVFDQPDTSANVFNDATLDCLAEQLDVVTGDSQAAGIVFKSAKPSIFIAGADLKALSEVESEDALRELIGKGQAIFTRIAKLEIPTLAAIHGACLGGGYELCLACDIRIASDDGATRIGLPETALGILPAWGGCTRLPRLIGLPGALDVILGGKRLTATSALRRGMVDEVVPREHLDRAAAKAMQKGAPPRKSHFWVNNFLSAAFIAATAQRQSRAKTRGHYPAIPRAIEVAVQGLRRSEADSLKLELEAVVDLSATATCRRLMEIFFLQERAKRLRSSESLVLEPIGDIAVIGAGVMGAGIAQWVSARKHRVILRDIDPEQVMNGLRRISGIYKDAVKRHIFDKVTARQGMDRISPVSEDVPLQQVDLVIEAAAESLNVKQKIFLGLSERSRSDTILATNTSALSIDEIAESVEHPERVVGLHFFNPVHRMQLVEVVEGHRTSPEVVWRTVKFVQSIGRLPVLVKDRPGFLVNRILMPYLVEAGHLFESGASCENLDSGMLEFGMPMGPLRLIDEVGVDVALHVGEYLASCFPDHMQVPAVLTEMIQAGQLGRKAGMGFYIHARGKSPTVNDALDSLRKNRAAAKEGRKELAERMVFLMINEAARCLEEAVVEDPRDIDFAMIMGTGFAPFRGGPLRHADTVGIARVVDGLRNLAEENPRFAPCGLLEEMAIAGREFYKKENP